MSTEPSGALGAPRPSDPGASEAVSREGLPAVGEARVALPGNIIGRIVVPQTDCWIWNGATDRGYGRVFIDGTAKRVHKVVWEALNGPVPAGLQLDHLCRVRACVNPDHLEVVTNKVNVRRAQPYLSRGSVTEQAIPKELRKGTRPSRERDYRPLPRTHCVNGHEYAADRPVGTPHRCLECRNRRASHQRAASPVPRIPRAPRTHCRRGHEYGTDNFYRTPTGRQCKTCVRERYLAKKAEFDAAKVA